MTYRRIIIPLLILGILAGVVSPLVGVQKAYAENMGDAFPDVKGDDPDGVYQINPANFALTPVANYANTTTTAGLHINLKFDPDAGSIDSAPPKDGGVGNGGPNDTTKGNKIVDGELETGGFDSIFDNDLEKTGENGIFLVISTDKSASKTTGPNNIAFETIDQAKSIPYTIQGQPAIYTYDGNNKAKNVSYFLLRTDTSQFFGQQTFGFNMIIQGLTAGQQYHAQAFMVEDKSAANIGYSNVYTFSTPTVNPSAQALAGNQGVTSGSTGSTDPNAQESLFGDIIPCEATSPSTWFTGCLVLAYYKLIYTTSAYLLFLAGRVFDLFAAFSLGSMVYKDPSFIYEGWRIVRDLANIFFIFILLYLSIGIILNMHINAKKSLAKLIIIALIINFSLFFTRVIIDTSNVLARVFYNEITISAKGNTPLLDEAKLGVQEKSLSAGVVTGLNIQSILSKDTYDKLQANGGISTGTLFVIITLGIIVNLVAAWTFLMCAIYFVGRILGLWFSMIFAPMAFVSSIVPAMSSKLEQIGWAKWVSTLTGLAIMAPMFMFFMYLIVAFIQSKFLDGLLLKSTTIDTIPFLVMLILQFMLIIGLLKAASSTAKKFSGEFGEAVAGAAKGAAMVIGAGAGVAMGGAAILGRKTLGSAGSRIASSEGLKDAAAGSGIKGWAARRALFNAQNTSKASFDLRQNAAANALSKATGANFNALTSLPGLRVLGTDATAGGYEGAKVRKAEQMRKTAERLGYDHDKTHTLQDNIDAREKMVSKTEDEAEKLQGYVKRAQAGGGNYVDPATGISKSTAEWQDELNIKKNDLRKLKKGDPTQIWTAADVGVATKLDGSKVTAAEIGKDKDPGLDGMKKGLERLKTARAKDYYWNKMKDNATQKVEHEADRDAFGSIKKYGHFDKNVPGARQMGKDIMNGVWAGVRSGLTAGMVAAPFTGGLSAVVGTIGGAVTGGVLGAWKSRFNNIASKDFATDTFGYQSSFEGAKLAGDIGHSLHGSKSNYKSPSANFFKIFESSSGGHGGGHAGGEHDTSHGGDDHGHGGGHH